MIGERAADACLVVPVVLAHSLTRPNFPQTRNMIRGRCTQHFSVKASTGAAGVPVTRYAESALHAASQTHRWWPDSVLSYLNSSLDDIVQILTEQSDEHVARYLGAA